MYKHGCVCMSIGKYMHVYTSVYMLAATAVIYCKIKFPTTHPFVFLNTCECLQAVHGTDYSGPTYLISLEQPTHRVLITGNNMLTCSPTLQSYCSAVHDHLFHDQHTPAPPHHSDIVTTSLLSLPLSDLYRFL